MCLNVNLKNKIYILSLMYNLYIKIATQLEILDS